MTADIRRLRELTVQDKASSLFFQVVADRLRTRRDTTPTRVTRLLKDRGMTISRADARDRLTQWAGLGLGSISKSKGFKIEWHYDLISIGKVATGLANDLKPMHLVAERHYMATPATKKVAAITIENSNILIRSANVTVEVSLRVGMQRVSEIIHAMKGS